MYFGHHLHRPVTSCVVLKKKNFFLLHMRSFFVISTFKRSRWAKFGCHNLTCGLLRFPKSPVFWASVWHYKCFGRLRLKQTTFLPFILMVQSLNHFVFNGVVSHPKAMIIQHSKLFPESLRFSEWWEVSPRNSCRLLNDDVPLRKKSKMFSRFHVFPTGNTSWISFSIGSIT